MHPLSALLDKYGHNDPNGGTDKTSYHTYGDVYDRLLGPLRERATAVLEIGFAAGFALQAFSEFFSNAIIHGIDVNDHLSPIVAGNPRIETYRGDATEAATICHFKTTYEIIIEDAFHSAAHQIRHFLDYSPFVRPGGFYVIEDVKTENLEEVKLALFPRARATGFEPSIFDLRDRGPDDNILMVFRKLEGA